MCLHNEEVERWDSVSVVEDIREEAKKILRHFSALRSAHPRVGKVVTLAQVAAELRANGEPNGNGSPSEIYRDALHFWARRAASQLTFDEWQRMVDDLAETEKFDGDVISFMENLFSDMTTKDGRLILA